ncbi:MAG: efflux RND transporter periplasmic adaptor subunit, partial [Lachnospiraceae bacterium]|nr:efflux RND transporter periplasmic adaptor subunit [Lachnospiraceae bacterium]
KFKRKGLKFIFIAVLAVAVVTGIVIFAMNRNNASYAQADKKKQAGIMLKKMDLTKSISATGKIESGSSKTVSAQLNGLEVKKVYAAVGSQVKKGDKLLEFDTTDLEENLAEARENLEEAREDYNSSVSLAQSRLTDAQSTYDSDKKSLDKKVSDMKKSLDKIKKQVKKLKKSVANAQDREEKISLEEQLSKAEESKKNIQNEYETAKNNRENTNKQNSSSIDNAEESLRTARSGGQKSIKEAEKQVKEAEEQLAGCKVKATASGTVTAVYVEAGSIYNGGDIVQIDNISSYKVVTSVDEYDISSISKGQRVVILTAATDEEELEGKITFIAPSAGNTGTSGINGVDNSSSSGYEVEIAINTKDERLRMGMTARCSIILEEAKDVFAVPYDAIHENQDGTNVIYVEDISARDKGMDNNGIQGNGMAGAYGKEMPDQDVQEREITEESGNTQDSNGYREIEVTKGMESDYYVEISGDGLSEGLRVIIPTDSDISDGNEDTNQDTDSINLPGMGGMPGGMPGGGFSGGMGNRKNFSQ